MRPRTPRRRTAGASLHQHALRTLRAYFAVVRDADARLGAAPQGEILHAYRVYLRRFRAAVRLFAVCTDHTSLPALAPALKELGGVLGKVRDTDIWAMRTKEWARQRGVAKSVSSRRYRGVLRRRMRSRQRELLAELKVRRARALLARVDRALNAARPKCPCDRSVRAFACATLQRLTERVVLGLPTGRDARALHAFRRRVRRARYAAEVLGGALGPVGTKLERALKGVADALGTVHDMDVGVARLRARGGSAPAWVGAEALRVRKRALKRFESRQVVLMGIWRSKSLQKQLRMGAKEQDMKLYVIRHGIAAAARQRQSDRSRVLTARGRKRGEAVGQGLRVVGWAPQRLYTSPLVRARQTARILADEAITPPVLRVVPWLSPGTSPLRAVREIARARTSEVAIVGHMPHLGALVALLVAGPKAPPVPLKKAGVCCIAFDGAVAPGSGSLLWLMQPRHLAKIAGCVK